MEITNTFVSILGLFLVHHMRLHATSLKILSDRAIQSQFLPLSCLILMNLLLFSHVSAVFFPQLMFIILFFPAATVTIYARRAFWWRKNQIRLLKKIKMKVRAGSSLKKSLSEALSDEPNWLCEVFFTSDQAIAKHGLHQMFYKEVNQCAGEINLVMNSNSRILEKLESLIQTKKVIQKLGQKSSSALAQARAQAAAAAVVYFLVLIWRSALSDERATPGMIIFSLGLFLLGGVGLLVLGREFKWKT